MRFIKPSKLIAFLITVTLWPGNLVFSQANRTDSLKKILSTQADTLKVKTLIKIADRYDREEKYDTALTFYLDALKLAEDTRNKERIFQSLMEVAWFYEHQRKRDLALEFALNAKKIAQEAGDNDGLFQVLDLIGGYIYFNQQNFDQSLYYGLELKKIADKTGDKNRIAYTRMYLGDVYRVQKKFDTAIASYSLAIKAWKGLRDTGMIRTSLNNIGVIYEAQHKYDTAIVFYLQALKIAEQQNDHYMMADYSETVARSYLDLKNHEQALLYAKRALELFEQYGNKRNLAEMYSQLAYIYELKSDYKEAYTFLSRHNHLKDSLVFGTAQSNIDSLQARYKTEKTEKEIEFFRRETALQSRLRNTFIAASALLVALAFLIANKYRVKKRSETLLNSKNAALIQTLDELKATQSQLIQSEKMASLGELTAGIAHEIQNPLNFVNNFSEVNAELIEDLRKEQGKEDRNPEIENEIMKDIDLNLQKIAHHGKRADAIVKGMLQHSRRSSGQKEPTNINELANEYLRLAYHGLRAKDKSFNATMKTDLDESIGNIDIIPQDIGRIILNLINNAFYAVTEKRKQAGPDYEPIVSVSTKKLKNTVEIRVKDNGIGIPQKIVDKIFQPFFTTKPTGQGTGLGLSLAYDIVKAHGGELKVETKDGEGSEFIIQLPTN